MNKQILSDKNACDNNNYGIARKFTSRAYAGSSGLIAAVSSRRLLCNTNAFAHTRANTLILVDNGNFAKPEHYNEQHE